MNNEEGKIWFGAGLDTTQLRADCGKATNMFKGVSNSVESEGTKISNTFKNIGIGVAGLFTAQKAAEICKNIATVRGEFQQLEVAFSTMLGNSKQGMELMNQMVTKAATTPFTLKEVASGAKQLLAYGTAAQDVSNTLTTLGNIASGLSIPLGDLIYLYGTTQVQGRLFTMDLRQFMGRGIPLAEELAKQFGVSKDKIADMVTAGKVGFPAVQKALEAMSGEGGKFNNLMEKQSHTITGQISNLTDKLDMMFNTIGKDNEGFINDSLEFANTLISNYEQIGKILIGLVAVYGTYKAAVIAFNAVSMLSSQIQLEAALAGTTLTTVQGIQAVAVKGASAAWSMFNKTMLSNPFVFITTALAASIVAIWAFRDSTTNAEKAMASYNSKKDVIIEAEKKHKAKIDELIESSRDAYMADTQRVDALELLKKEYPKIFEKYDIETIKLADILKLKKEIAEIDSKKTSDKNKFNLAFIDSQINKYTNALKYVQNRTTRTDEEEDAKQEEIRSLNNKIDVLKQERFKWYKDVQKDKANTWTANIKSLSDAELNFELDYRKKIIARTKKYEGNYNLTAGSLTGMFDKAELVNQTATLENEYKRRNATTYKYVDYEKNLLNKLTEAKKNLANIEKSKDKYSEADWNRLVEDAKSSVEEAEKNLKKYAVHDFSKAAENAANKATEKANKEKVEAQQRLLSIKENNAKVQDMIVQSEFDARQAVIDASEEGYAKQEAQLVLNYDREKEVIKKKSDELISIQQENERKLWENNNPDSEKKGLIFVPATTLESQLPKNQRDMLASDRNNAMSAYITGQKNLYQQLINENKSFIDQRIQAEKTYNEAVALLTKNRTAENSAEIDRTLEVLKKNYQDKLDSITVAEYEATKANSSYLVQLFSDTSDYSIKQIQSIIEKTRELFDFLKKTPTVDINSNNKSAVDLGKSLGLSTDFIKKLKDSPKLLKEFQEAFKKFNDDLGQKAPMQKYLDDIKKGFANIKAGGTENIGKGISQIGSSISSIAPQLKDFGNDLGTIFGDEGVGDYIGTIAEFAGNIGQVGQGVGKMMSGDIIGGIQDTVKGIANIIGMGAKANAIHEAALRMIEKQNLAYERQYELLTLEKQLTYGDTDIFGVDNIKKAINAIDVYTQAIKAYKEELKGSAPVQFTNSLINSLTNYSEKLKNYEAGIGALNNIQVKTGHKKTGLFGWGSGKDIFTNITEIDKYKELIDANGKLNVEMAKSIIANETLSEGAKETLQNLIDLTDKETEAYQQMSDVLKDTFGSLSESIMDSLVSIIQNDGVNAWELFGEKGASVLENLGEQIAYSLFFKAKFDNLQKELEAVYSSTTDVESAGAKQMALVADFYKSIGSDMTAAQAWMENWQDEAKKSGFDIWSSSSRTGQSEGIAAASQDTVDQLDGRMTVANVHLFNIDENMALLLNVSNLILNKVIEIRNDTVRLEAIENDNKKTREILESISINGIIIKR